MAARLSNEIYYDEFADWYERERHDGYHAVIDDLETDLVISHCPGQDILEVGCGTGLILHRVAQVAGSHLGVDLSSGMLRRAVDRGLHVVQGDATALPCPDAAFDVVYSFKVLSHVQRIDKALAELARVTRPGGRLFLEFYNRHSLRYVAKRLTTPGKISDATDESAVFTRWYSLTELVDLLPPELELVDVAGVRVITPAARVHQVPGVRRVFRRAEFGLRDSRLGRFGGFLVLGLRRR